MVLDMFWDSLIYNSESKTELELVWNSSRMCNWKQIQDFSLKIFFLFEVPEQWFQNSSKFVLEQNIRNGLLRFKISRITLYAPKWAKSMCAQFWEI